MWIWKLSALAMLASRSTRIYDNVWILADSSPLNSKIQRGFANYEKNTGNVHPNFVRGAIQRRDGGTGTVALKDDNSELWEGEITVGTPAVTFKGKHSSLRSYIMSS